LQKKSDKILEKLSELGA